MRSKYIFLLLLTLLASCKQGGQGTIGESKGPTMPGEITRDSLVDYSTLDTLIFHPDNRVYESSDILDVVKLIRLETNEECLIGSVGKVQFVGGMYYLLDDYTARNAIHVFDTQGNHVHSLKRIGRGPGEYKDILDFDVDISKNLFILNSIGNIIEYDSLLQYKRTINQEIAIRTISVYNGLIIGIAHGDTYKNPQGRLLHFLSSDGRSLSGLMRYSQGSSNYNNRRSTLTKSKDKLYVNIPFSPIIYSIDTAFNVKAEYYLVLNYIRSDGKTANRFFTDPHKDFFFSDQLIYCSTALPLVTDKPTFYTNYSGFSTSGQTFFPKRVRGRLSDGVLNPLQSTLIGLTEDGIGISVMDVSYLQGNLRFESARVITDSTGVRHRVYSDSFLGSDTLPGSLYDIIKNLNETDNPCIVLVKLKPFGSWNGKS
ncbi:MAG: 6-bladed beta-propeller [Bacteroidales bacterium]|nr:6-bladed beta-propeller [Bacteroidales bacterium]